MAFIENILKLIHKYFCFLVVIFQTWPFASKYVETCVSNWFENLWEPLKRFDMTNFVFWKSRAFLYWIWLKSDQMRAEDMFFKLFYNI